MLARKNTLAYLNLRLNFVREAKSPAIVRAEHRDHRKHIERENMHCQCLACTSSLVLTSAETQILNEQQIIF
jgi:hypothetical protein